MTRPAWLEKAAPYAPAVFLSLAVAAGGLRAPGAWLAFGALYLCWSALRPAGLHAAGREAAALFFCWVACAALFSPEPLVSMAALGGYGVLALFFFSAAPGDGEKSWLSAVYALGGLAAAALLAHKFSGGRVTGFIGGNPNYSAVFCAAAFAPAVLALSGAARRGKFLYGGFALLLAAGVAASGSRGAALAALLAAAAGLAAARRWRWLAGLAALVALLAALLPASALAGLLKLGVPRAFARPELWGAALKAAWASPLLGWGPGRFGDIFELFKFPFYDGWTYYGHSTLHAHGEFFNLAAEAGFPAAVFLLLAAVQGLYAGRKERLPFALAALAALLQASTDMIFYSGAVSLLFWGSLGFSFGGSPAPGAWRVKAGLAAAALLCLLAPYGGRLAVGGGFAALTRAESARSPVLALARARAAQAAAPKDPLAFADEGYALAAAGDPGGASGAFVRALELEPDFADARLALAGALGAAGRRAEACAALSGLPPHGPGTIRSGYERAIRLYDQARAAGLKKDLCGKRKTGAVTATPRKTRSTATK